MTKTTVLCDIYGTEGAKDFRIDDGTEFNGVETETSWFHIDLGHKAAIETLNFLVKKSLSRGQKAELMSLLKTQKRAII